MDALPSVLLIALGLPLAALGLIILLTKHHYGIAGIFVSAFTGGIPELLGVQPFYIKLLIEFSILVLFLSVFLLCLKNGKSMSYPGAFWMASFGGVSVASLIINHVPLLQFVYFIRIIFVPYVFFLIAANLNWRDRNLSMVLKILFLLYLLQLPAALVKLATVGPLERYIGTISIFEGSITTILVMLATAYLSVLYAETNKKKYLLLIVGFIGFGMIGMKRALIFFVPAIWFISVLLHGWQKEKQSTIITILLKPKLLRNISIALVGGMLVFYAVVRTNPTLNPEGRLGGSFDAGYLVDYIVDYNTREGKYSGRLSAPKYVWAVIASGGWRQELFGLGAGIITASRFVEGSKEYFQEEIGIGYGARNGIWFLLLQVGILGVGLYFAFMVYLLRSMATIRAVIVGRYNQCLVIVCQMCIVIYFFDMVMYSTAMMKTHALILPFMWIAGVLTTYNRTTPQSLMASKMKS